MGVIDMSVEVEPGTCAKSPELKLEGSPWNDGLLTVNIESVTSAIAWLAAQLRGEAAARLKLEARLEAFDGASGESRHLHESVISGDHQEVSSNDAQAASLPTQQGLARRVQQLEKDLASHKRQQELRAKQCEELCKLQMDALRCDVQSRVKKTDLSEFGASLLADARGAARSEARESVQAAFADEVAGLHSKLETMSGMLQSQLQCFDERLTDLAQHISECDQELDLVRACSAEGATASVVSTSSTDSPAEDCADASTSQSTSDRNAAQSRPPLPMDAVPRPVSSGNGGALHAAVEVASQTSDVKAGGKGLVGSRRPSSVSVASTVPETNGCNSARESTSNLHDHAEGSHFNKEFVAWVTDQVNGLHGQIAELALLAQQSKVHDTTGGEGAFGSVAASGSFDFSSDALPVGDPSMASLNVHLHDSAGAVGRDAAVNSSDRSSHALPVDDSSKGDPSVHLKNTDDVAGSASKSHSGVTGNHANDTAQHLESKVNPSTSNHVASSLTQLPQLKEEDLYNRLQELRLHVDGQMKEIQRHIDGQAGKLQKSLLSELDAQNKLWKKDLQQWLQHELDARRVMAPSKADVVESSDGSHADESRTLSSIKSSDIDTAQHYHGSTPFNDQPAPAPTLAALQDELQRLAEKQAQHQRDCPASEISKSLADMQKRVGLVEKTQSHWSVDPNEVAAIKARLPRLEGRLGVLESWRDSAVGVGESGATMQSGQKNTRGTKATGNSKQHLSDNTSPQDDDTSDVEAKLAQVARDSQAAREEGRREIANVSLAVGGMQRALNLTTGKVEDLTHGLRSLQAKVDGAMPQLLEALRAMASRDGNTHSQDTSTSLDSAAVDGSTGASGAAGKTEFLGPVSIDSLQKLINKEIQDVQQLYVSPDALHRAVKALENDMHGCFDKIRRDIQDCLRSKADTHELQSLIAKLKELEQAAVSALMYEEVPLEGDSIENAAGVRRPLAPSRCISCNRGVDLVSPWERRMVPNAPWPPRFRSNQTSSPRHRSTQNASPVPARRRESSLPAISRENGASMNS